MREGVDGGDHIRTIPHCGTAFRLHGFHLGFHPPGPSRAMTIPDDDLPRAASVLIAEHGGGAWREATERYHAFAAAGDRDNAALWLRIATSIHQIARTDADLA